MLYKEFNPWDEITTPYRLRDLLARGGVPEPRAEAVAGHHPLTAPADFWQIVLGSGYRATVDALPVQARSRVRDRIIDRLRRKEIATVRTDVVYGTGLRPLL